MPRVPPLVDRAAAVVGVVCVGGAVVDRSVAPPKLLATASVEALDLSTMRWSGAG